MILGRFLRENLWPIVTIVVFGLVLWATLSLTTLAQQKENRIVLLAKSYPEELRLAKAEGILPPPPTPLPRKTTIPPEKDAALVYAVIDVNEIPKEWEVWKGKDYRELLNYSRKWMSPKERNPLFDAKIDQYLQQGTYTMKIAERASRLPLSSVDTAKDGDMAIREFAIRDLLVTSICRVGESDITTCIKYLDTLLKVTQQFNLSQPDHVYEITVMRLFRSIYKDCVAHHKDREKEMLLGVMRKFKLMPFDEDAYHKMRITVINKRIEEYEHPKEEEQKPKELENPLIIKAPKEDVFLDINAYLRFLNSTDRVLQEKIYGKGWFGTGAYYLAYNLLEIRTVDKKRREHPEKRSPREDWKFYKAIEDDLKKAYSEGYWGGYTSQASSYLVRLLRWRQTRTMIALYEYREKHGAFPETLDLLPLDTPIIDPIMEKPFLWKKDSKRGWLLYSPGLDEKDNGGADRDVPADVRDIVVELGK
jgi:hypothetical protein